MLQSVGACLNFSFSDNNEKSRSRASRCRAKRVAFHQIGMKMLHQSASLALLLIAHSGAAGALSATPAPSTTPIHRAGFVSIVGVPNVGKSTLFNALTETAAQELPIRKVPLHCIEEAAPYFLFFTWLAADIRPA